MVGIYYFFCTGVKPWQTKISLGDRSTSRRGTLVAVITCPGLPGHFGLFSKTTYKVVWAEYFLSWSEPWQFLLAGASLLICFILKLNLIGSSWFER